MFVFKMTFFKTLDISQQIDSNYNVHVQVF